MTQRERGCWCRSELKGKPLEEKDSPVRAEVGQGLALAPQRPENPSPSKDDKEVRDALVELEKAGESDTRRMLVRLRHQVQCKTGRTSRCPRKARKNDAQVEDELPAP